MNPFTRVISGHSLFFILCDLNVSAVKKDFAAGTDIPSAGCAGEAAEMNWAENCD
jgi:hypothetical protein